MIENGRIKMAGKYVTVFYRRRCMCLICVFAEWLNFTGAIWDLFEHGGTIVPLNFLGLELETCLWANSWWCNRLKEQIEKKINVALDSLVP